MIAPSSSYPRTLIVGNHMSEFSGTGVFLRMLFTGWPAARLACISSSGLTPDWTRCHHYYRTGDQEFRLRPPLSWIAPARNSGPVPSPILRPESSNSVPRTNKLARHLARHLWHNVIRPSGGDALYQVAPSAQLLAWIRGINPEIIYGQCADLASVRFLRRIQQALGLPLVLHLMDDWAGTLYQTMSPSRFLRSRYQSEFAEVIQSAAVVLGICREMAEVYEQRYHRPVLWLHNPVDLEAYRPFTRSQWSPGKPFRLRYGGRVGWAIRNSLVDISKTVSSLHQKGFEISFDVTTSNQDQLPGICRKLPGVSVCSPCPLAELPRLQAEADVLIVCYDFDAESMRLARYSMPGKMAECMASGTPILVYGPAGLPVVEYAKRLKWGYVVDTPDPVKLSSAVQKLFESAALRERLGQTALRVASERHDAKQVSLQLHDLIQSALRPSVKCVL